MMLNNFFKKTTESIFSLSVMFVMFTVVTVGVIHAREANIESFNANSLAIRTNEARRTGIVIATQKVMPSVVSITALQTKTYTSPFYNDPFFREFFGNLFPHEYNREIQSLGSGIIISSKGEIITNAHVIADASKIKVTLSDEKTYDSKVIGKDEALDLALLRVINPPDNLQAVNFGNSDDLMIGEWAIALGNPFGFLIADTKPTVTAGVISAIDRRVQTAEGKRFSFSGVIQTDAAINPGNSGGPLVNILGEVIGINTFIFTQSGGSEGIGFAIPINRVKRFIAELETHNEKRDAWLGIGVQTLTSDMARALGKPEIKGLIINQIVTGSPASKAGLEEAWVITSINGIHYSSETDWQMVERSLFVGDSVKLKGITDQGSPFSRTLIAAEYITPKPVKIAELGLAALDLDPAIKYRYNIRSATGVVIESIEDNGEAARLGLKKGDVILKYGNIETPDIKELKQAVRTLKNPTTLVIEREGGRYRLYRRLR